MTDENQQSTQRPAEKSSKLLNFVVTASAVLSAIVAVSGLFFSGIFVPEARKFLTELGFHTADGPNIETTKNNNEKPSDKDKFHCIIEAREIFKETIANLIKNLPSNNPGISAQEYFTLPSPKAFALCIDWKNSTPARRAGIGHGFGTSRNTTSQIVVDSYAQNYCNKSMWESGYYKCSCIIVDRGNKIDLPFDSDWPSSCQ